MGFSEKFLFKLNLDIKKAKILSDFEKIIYCIKIFRCCLNENSKGDRKILRQLKTAQQNIENYIIPPFFTNEVTELMQVDDLKNLLETNEMVFDQFFRFLKPTDLEKLNKKLFNAFQNKKHKDVSFFQ
jgi:hypothetical protein